MKVDIIFYDRKTQKETGKKKGEGPDHQHRERDG